MRCSSAPLHTLQPAKRASQRGAALILALLVALTLALGLFFRPGNALSPDAARAKRTEYALAQAKTALIAWSVLQGDIGTGTNPRPGSLPCPAINNSGTQSANCSITSLGRLPWKTLGTEELRDADGEVLWYALSANFRRPGLNNNAINSDTRGTLQLYASDGVTVLTPAGEELAAIIFSPGSPLTGQNRTGSPNTPTDYLDSANGRNNANAAGPFISGPVKDSQGDTVLNDRALAISSRELISAIEKRALKEAQNALAAYALNHGGKYPNPAKYNGANCATTITNIGSPTTCSSDSSVCFGRLPEDVLGPYVSSWFQQNAWGRALIYAVKQNNVINGSAAECSSSLAVDGQQKSYVILSPGSPISTQNRPSTALVDYLENAANTDTWSSLSSGQSIFSTPDLASNDQMRSMP